MGAKSLQYKSAELKKALEETSDTVRVLPIQTIPDEVVMDIVTVDGQDDPEAKIEVMIVEEELPPFSIFHTPEEPLVTEPLAVEIGAEEEVFVREVIHIFT